MIAVRPYEQRDWLRIEAIHDQARRQELALAGLEAAFVPLRIAAEREALFDYALLVAELDGETAGFAAFCPGELAWLYVDPAMMRRGVGKALAAVLAQCEGTVTAEVLLGNLPAKCLYESMGFTVAQVLSGVMPGNETFPVSVWAMERA